MIFKNKLNKQFFLIYLFSYLTAPMGYFIKILFAKNLSVEQFGLIYSILGFFGLISIFNDLGMSETLNYFGVKFYEKKNWFKLKVSFYYAIMMQGLTSITISIVLFFLSDFLMKNYFKVKPSNILIYFLLHFIFVNVTIPLRIIFNTSKKYSYGSIFGFSQIFLTLILSFLIIFYELSFELLALCYGIPFLILFFIYIYIIYSKDFCNFKKVKFQFNFKLYKKLLRYALVVVIGSGGALLLGRIDIFFITTFLNVSKVGFYEIALSLSSIIPIILGPIIGIIFPMTTSLIEEKKTKELNLILTKLYKIFIILGIPFVILFTSFPDIIIKFLFGENYLESSKSLIILSIGILFSLFQGINFSILAGLGKVKQRNYIMYIGGVLNIILNLVLIKILGIVGVAIATSFVFVFMFTSSYFLNKKYNIKILLKLKEILKIIFCNLIFFFLIFYLKKIISFNLENIFLGLILETILVCLISFSIYSILIFKLKVLNLRYLKK